MARKGNRIKVDGKEYIVYSSGVSGVFTLGHPKERRFFKHGSYEIV